jgi:hypothetical protein
VPGNGYRVIGGAVIGQNNFQVGVSLPAQSGKACLQVVRAVVVGDDDGEEGGLTHRRSNLNPSF